MRGILFIPWISSSYVVLTAAGGAHPGQRAVDAGERAVPVVYRAPRAGTCVNFAAFRSSRWFYLVLSPWNVVPAVVRTPFLFVPLRLAAGRPSCPLRLPVACQSLKYGI